MFDTPGTTTYQQEIQNFVQWCGRHFLTLSVNITQEMIFDPKSFGDHLRYGISAWPGNLTVWLKAHITWLTHRAMKKMKVRQHPTVQSIFTRQAQKIISDPTHALHPEYHLLPSGRCFRVPKCRLNHFKNFCPAVHQSPKWQPNQADPLLWQLQAFCSRAMCNFVDGSLWMNVHVWAYALGNSYMNMYCMYAHCIF